MAKIQSETIAIELSRIAKDGQELDSIVTADIVTTLEQVVQELVGSGAIVEVKEKG